MSVVFSTVVSSYRDNFVTTIPRSSGPPVRCVLWDTAGQERVRWHELTSYDCQSHNEWLSGCSTCSVVVQQGKPFAPVISSEIPSLLTLVSILLSFAVSMFNWKLFQERTSSDPGV